MDLALTLDESRGRRAGLEDALRTAVLSGQLVEGARLPSTRQLATELGWSRATVVAAYEQLTAEGYLHSRHGSATTVSGIHRPAPARTPTTPAIRVPSPPRFDFRPGEPDVGAFPRSAWMASLRSALATASDQSLAYDHPQGHPALREVLAGYLGRARAVVTDPDQIMVVGGFASAVWVLGDAFRRLGMSSMAFEEPCLWFHRDLAASTGLQIEPVAVDESGLDVSALADTDARAVITTPAHQYPLGVPLAPHRRTELVAWANAVDGYIVEDDYDGEFRYDRAPLGSLQGLEPSRVIYGGTASKSLAPGLALAWLAVPHELVQPIAHTRWWRVAVSTVEQLALADFIATGRLDRHLRRMRVVYRRRRDELIEVLRTVAPTLEVTGISAGLHVAVTLPAGGPTEDELVAAARERSIGLLGLGAHTTRPTPRPALVLGYSRPPQHAFSEALDELGAFLSEHLT